MKPRSLIKLHAVNTYWGSGVITPSILNLGTKWTEVVSFTPWGKGPRYRVDRRPDGTQSRSGCRELIPGHPAPMYTICCSENLAGKDAEDLGVDGVIILKWTLRKQGGSMWTGCIYLSIGTSGGFIRVP